MDRSSIEYKKFIRSMYYSNRKQYERASEIADQNNIYKPILKIQEVHPEDEPSVMELNLTLEDIFWDLDILESEMIGSGSEFRSLMDSSVLRLYEIDRNLSIEEDRLKDLNMLCGKDTEFNIVLPITSEDLDGDFSEDNGVFSAKIQVENKVNCIVDSIRGNGYEGNSHVYVNNKPLKNSLDTSDRRAIIDNNLSTFYEYSKINASRSEKIIFPLINFDNSEAQCSIILKAESKINKIKIKSKLDNIILKEIATSEDNITFTTIQRSPIEINNEDQKYKDSSYIYGSGVICFPSSRYIKITLESGGYSNDKIAFEYIDSNL